MPALKLHVAQFSGGRSDAVNLRDRSFDLKGFFPQSCREVLHPNEEKSLFSSLFATKYHQNLLVISLNIYYSGPTDLLISSNLPLHHIK